MQSHNSNVAQGVRGRHECELASLVRQQWAGNHVLKNTNLASGQKDLTDFALLSDAATRHALCLPKPAINSSGLCAWRLLGFGGAPIPVSRIAQLASHCPAVRLFDAYGATETIMPATLTAPGSGQLDAVGVTVPCARVVVMDEHAFKVLQGKSGEIWIAGPRVEPWLPGQP